MKKIVLITGTSHGFGKLTAIKLASMGHKVYAGMRNTGSSNKETADELGSMENIEVIELDVTVENSIENSIKHIQANENRIDVLINNAGSVGMGLSELYGNREIEKMFSVNVFGVFNLTNKIIPIMREQKSGLIISMSSVLGRLFLPTWSTYCASKAALEAMAESWRYELAAVGIDSVVIEPGAFPSTNIFNRKDEFSPQHNSSSIIDEYGVIGQLPKMFLESQNAMIDNNKAPNPQQIADAIANLMNLPSGKRPFRTVIDENMKLLIERMNSETDAIHSTFLGK